MLKFCPHMSKSLEKSLFWPIKPCISPLSRKMHTLKMFFFQVFYLKYFGTFFLLIRHIVLQKEGHIYSTRFKTQQQNNKIRLTQSRVGQFFWFLPNSSYRCILQFWKFDPTLLTQPFKPFTCRLAPKTLYTHRPLPKNLESPGLMKNIQDRVPYTDEHFILPLFKIFAT